MTSLEHAPATFETAPLVREQIGIGVQRLGGEHIDKLRERVYATLRYITSSTGQKR